MLRNNHKRQLHEKWIMKKKFLFMVLMLIIMGMMATSVYAIESSDLPTITGIQCTDYNTSSNTYFFSWDEIIWPELPESVPLTAYDPTFGYSFYWSTDKENWDSNTVSYAKTNSYISGLEEGKTYYIKIQGWFKTTSRVGSIHSNYTYGQYSDIFEFVANKEKSVAGYQEPSETTPSSETDNGSGSSSKTDDDSGSSDSTSSENSESVYTVGAFSYTLDNNTATIAASKAKTVTKLTIPATVRIDGKSVPVTAIAPNAFKGMKKLTTVTIGKNIKTIGKNAFNGCKKLKKITIKTTKLTKKSVGANAFKGIYKKAVIKCPKSKKAAYKKFLLKKGMKKTMTFK